MPAHALTVEAAASQPHMELKSETHFRSARHASGWAREQAGLVPTSRCSFRCSVAHTNALKCAN